MLADYDDDKPRTRTWAKKGIAEFFTFIFGVSSLYALHFCYRVHVLFLWEASIRQKLGKLVVGRATLGAWTIMVVTFCSR